jgi:hypothetical protein
MGKRTLVIDGTGIAQGNGKVRVISIPPLFFTVG